MKLLKKLGLSLLVLSLFAVAPAMAQAASSVLTWNAVTTNVNGDPITGVTYNMYRSPNADMSAKTKLNTTAITATTFTDTTLPASTTVYYQVHAVSSSGVEGAGSNIVRFNTNDRPPAAPTGFTVR